MRRETFFDLTIDTLAPGEVPSADAHWVRTLDPARRDVEIRRGEGWFYKPCYVTWLLAVPGSVDAYIRDSFRSGARNKPRKLLREVPRRYRLEVDEDGRRVEAFKDLYRRTIVARARGKDRVGEHEDGFGAGWTGFHLFDGETLAAGILVYRQPGHDSVAYGAFDPVHRRELDLEHFLIMQAIDRCARQGVSALSLGMDTNRYGHHLPLGLPAYKLRIGFTPLAWEPAGREVASCRRFDVFEDGLFFFSYDRDALVGNLFTRGEPDLRPFAHHTAPPVRTFRI